MNAPKSPNSWQYRGLNAKNPGLDHLSNGLVELVKAGHNVVATVTMEGEWDHRDPLGEARWMADLARRTGRACAAAPTRTSQPDSTAPADAGREEFR